MQKRLSEFAAELGLELTEKSTILLLQYADLVWQKKEQLNLTSVTDKEEILTRHICDGLVAAAYIAKYDAADQAAFTAADMGAGAGYIGMTLGIALPHIGVSLVESLERRCAFLNWAIMKLGIQNVTVINIRLGQQAAGCFDVVTERAMGQLADVLPLIGPSVKEGGRFLAYQSSLDNCEGKLLVRSQLQEEPPYAYKLMQETKERYLRVFVKYGHC